MGFTPTVLKELGNVMAGLLSTVYQRSWEPGEVPADWKLTNVIPNYKKTRKREKTKETTDLLV